MIDMRSNERKTEGKEFRIKMRERREAKNYTDKALAEPNETRASYSQNIRAHPSPTTPSKEHVLINSK